MTNRGNYDPDSYLPSEDCALLTSEEKELWGKLAPTMKCLTLKGKISNSKPNNRFNNNELNNPRCETIEPPFESTNFS